MSALAKPFITSSRATNDVPVNAEKVTSYGKLTPIAVSTIAGAGDAAPVEYSVVFSYGILSHPDVVWTYADETDRDDDFAAIATLIAGVTA